MNPKIVKFQRHPTQADCVILHFEINADEVKTRDIVNQLYRDALEAAGKLED